MGTYYVDPDAAGANDGSSWTDAFTDLSGYEALGRNLVSLTESDTVNCRSSSGTADTSGTIYWSGWTTSATYDITIIGDNSSHEWDATAYRMVEAAGATIYDQSGHNVTFRNIQFDGGTATTVVDLRGGNFQFENCIFTGSGLRAVYFHTSGAASFENCLFYGNDYGFWIQGSTDTIDVLNSVFDNNTGWSWDNSAATVNLDNCAIIEDNRGGSTATVNYDYCASENGVGTNAQTLSATQADDFADAPNNDYSPVSGGALVGNGNACPTNDITGSARTGDCDIGAIDFAAADITAPTITARTINAAGTSLTLTADEAITAGTGGNGGMSLSTGQTLTYSSGTGTASIVYSISPAVGSAETPTLSYTQPTDGWEDAAGNDLATFSAAAITNNSTVDNVAPSISAQSFNYNENQSSTSTVIATVSASDAVGVTSFVFTSTGTATSSDTFFSVNNSGHITLTTAGLSSIYNDYETGSNSVIHSVTAGDAASNTAAADITLNTQNVVEYPTIPAGWTSTTFTVDYASLDADSPFTDSAFSSLVTGDIVVYDETSVTGGFTVSISGTGVVTVTGIDSDQTFDYFIWDASDETSGTTDTISVTYIDTTPNAFSFTDQTDVALSTTITSAGITVLGINAATAVTCTGGTCSINGGTYSTSPGNAVLNDVVTARHTSSANNSTATDTIVTIGGVSDTFTSTTIAADTTPDAFTFTDQTDVALSTLLTSNAITVTGIEAATAISITGGEYSIDGGAYTAVSGSVTLNQEVTVRHTSSSSFNTATNTVLTIGGVSDTFTSTTLAFVDTTNPVITLLGSTPVSVNQDATYTDAGATASDDTDGDITANISTVNPVNTAIIAQYTVTYDVDDAAGNSATQVTRTVNVVSGPDVTDPLIGAQLVNYIEGQTEGTTIGTVSASDNVGVTGYSFTSTGTTTSSDTFYSINGTTGAIALTAAGVASDANDSTSGTDVYVHSVTVVDAAANSAAANVTLTVTAANSSNKGKLVYTLINPLSNELVE